MKQKSLKALEKQVKDFNEKHPVGSVVLVENDFGVQIPRQIMSQGEVIGEHSAVAWFEGISGCYSLDRVV